MRKSIKRNLEKLDKEQLIYIIDQLYHLYFGVGEICLHVSKCDMDSQEAISDMDKMDIDDKLNNVGNNFSISTDGLATSLQKSASALTTAGNDIDKSIALITAGNAVVQDPDSVGAGIRTIALRLTGTEEAKKELEETGEDTSDFIVQTASKVNDSFKAFTGVASNNFKGISLLDENGNLRDTYDVLQDVADIYDEMA